MWLYCNVIVKCVRLCWKGLVRKTDILRLQIFMWFSQFSAEDQDKMETQEIEIGRIKSPAIFYFTSKKWWSTFEVDFQQMQGYFEQRPPKVCNPSTLRSNDRVLVRNFCQRNIWRRAQICKVDLKRRSCKVLLIDTGEVEEDIDLGELYHLSRTPIDWAFFPPQGAKKLAVVGNFF